MSVRIRALLLAGLAATAVMAEPASARLDDPLPRVEDALCPGVAGFDIESALRIVDRIRANAQALDRRLANPETCKPNLVVAVVEDGQKTLQGMYRDAPYMFSDLTPTARRALLAETGPVHVFSQVATRTRDGQPVPDPNNLSDVPQSHGWMAHSKIYTAVREDIVHVMVLFDRAALAGKSVGQLADYATVRALIPTAVLARADSSNDTILKLFESGAAPRGMTEADRAFLAALYEGMPNLPGSSRLAELDSAADGRPVAE